MFEEKQAVLFDFDGILFSPASRWKVKNPRLGVLGSGISPEKMHAIFQELRSQDPDTNLMDHFTFDSFDVACQQFDSDVNVLPPRSLIPTAQSHLRNKRDLFILSARPYRGLASITEHLFEEYKKKEGKTDYFTRTNPFEGKSLLSPAVDEIPENPIRAKLAALAGIFLNREADEPPRFSRIYLYLSEEEFLLQLEIFLEKERDNLPLGRNTILPVFIAYPLQT